MQKNPLDVTHDTLILFKRFEASVIEVGAGIFISRGAKFELIFEICFQRFKIQFVFSLGINSIGVQSSICVLDFQSFLVNMFSH